MLARNDRRHFVGVSHVNVPQRIKSNEGKIICFYWRSERENYGDLVRAAKENSRGKGKIGKCNGRGNIAQETIGIKPHS